MPGIAGQINQACILIVVAGAENALERRDEAERDAAMADRLLARFSAERFGMGSRVRVHRMRARLKLLQRRSRRAHTDQHGTFSVWFVTGRKRPLISSCGKAVLQAF
jgi:hypothetical protein